MPTNTKLTFKLRQGVKWHDGKPFTAKDVQCTWRMLIGKGDVPGLPPQPARGLVVASCRTSAINGDFEATFELKRAAAEPAGAARERVLAGLSVPRAAADHAHAARSAPGRSSSSSSSAATRSAWCAIRTTSRRTGRTSTRSPSRSIDSRATRTAGVRDRRIRHHLSLRRQRAADEGREGARAERDLRDDRRRAR